MNGGGSTSRSSSPYAAPLFGLGVNQERTSLPLLQQLATQLGSMLRTGGTGAQQPIVNRAQDAQRQALSSSQTQTAQNLASQNIGGSQAANILGNQAMAGGEEIASTPTNIAQQFLQWGLPMVTGETGAGPMAAAGGLNRTTTATPGFWDLFMQGLEPFTAGAGFELGAAGIPAAASWMWPGAKVGRLAPTAGTP